ncbi:MULTISPECIES: ester cyclase [Chryseobacterium]|uniref:Ester cyclase n=1 Tax=Chryseobacterium camelliae TaxID=1265445 RepID=A0ABU0THW3_9FLAO|nr:MULTISPECIES: ester cyclase [Chryseobacterium]MDT3409488.1 putative ester cyclase [Pseudacidovorax intermedius]MDQ1096647.1 putative ester cyclase [Chryseobacterium camelliae]MDQ1100589.1 putative ester cyclase [Chryseobacterium sp. SORGH_AS_1048]MDR6087929.1 putative ester cyclase [Chryseobacterium sp. SORGH_AS_0909]MDR6132303.1 putative ester cyclase [Chryseobacterium sp. SORGH_AS_1175]
MVSKNIKFLIILLFIASAKTLYSQIKSPTHNAMATISNKEVVTKMYQTCLNQKQTETLEQYIDLSYLETFKDMNKPLLSAFPDIRFTIKEIFEDGNKVVTVYDWEGSHLGEYQKIPATHKKITVQGVSIYEFENGKIINSKAIPDKLSFFIQLGMIPKDFIYKNAPKKDWVYFVDEFEVPAKSYEAFKSKLEDNRKLIQKLKGFVKDEVIVNTDQSDRLTIMTIAIWENEQSLEEAKKTVQSEYESIHFNPAVFNKQLNIKMKRNTFSYMD